ncbi:hypothetical protein Vafri_3346 [Volvox africanus]|uniref:V-SNARE coiled-coil homology domain-containing protein n=1 Tax=Volvox africanus TaxID=51714 RepID=A0A8J4EUN2_9CHLO|nr:hypothetical protein Vafri_3346 [Volvox africanus]
MSSCFVLPHTRELLKASQMNMFGFGVASLKKKDGKSSAEVQTDRLRADALVGAERALLCASGIPGTADALAYEPVQGLVAISTSDGKVKLLGRPGCEVTEYSTARYPYGTRQLQFLLNRGVLVRVSKGGFMESWSVVSGNPSDAGVRSLGTVKVRGDKICCVADMARDPYVLLGCASGSLRIAMLVDSSGSPTTLARQARGFTVAPYRVRPHEMRGEGEVRQLAVQSYGPIHRALVLFTAGMVAIWDLRAVELTTSINPSSADATDYVQALADAGMVTAVCWIGTDRGDFATGHVDGSVLVWVLPGLDPGNAVVAAAMRVSSGTSEPVRMLRCVFGEVDGLLVLGGQEVEQPEALTWIPLLDGIDEEATVLEEDEEEEDSSDGNEEEESEGGRESGQSARGRCSYNRNRRDKGAAARQRSKCALFRLPWFGHLIGFSLVANGGYVTGYEPSAAVLQLVEGGQLVLYHLKDEQPHMVSPSFQQRSSITVTEAPLVPVRRPASCSPNAITLTSLRKVASESGDEYPGGSLADVGTFPCGTPPSLPSDATWGLLYCTGYKDGSVCLWDLHGGTTRLLCTAPAGDAVSELKRSSANSGSVTCLSLVWPAGLLLAGHHKGEVRVYQFSSTERPVDCITMESIGTPGVAHSLHQPAGLHLRLRVQVSSGEITSLAYCQAIRAVAVGDKAGGVALVDTAKPLVRWYAMPAQNAVLACSLAPVPLPPSRLRVPEVTGEEGTPSHAVFIADSEGCLAALDAARGCFIGRNGELSPKNRSYTLMLELLDENFVPIWSRQQVGGGCDQAALGSFTSGMPKAGRTSQVQGVSRDESDEGSCHAEEQRSRRGEGSRGQGRVKAGDEDEDNDQDSEGSEEDFEFMDAETLLAKAAMQVEGARSRRTSRRHRSGGGTTRSQEPDSSSPPAVLSSCPDPAAHYVLLVTDQYLRLYSSSNVLTAERSTLAKRSPAAQQQLVYARPIQVAGAPGVMALAAAEHGLCVQVYSLPSLELVHETPLSASLSWFWDVPPGRERRLGRLAATSRLGHLLLLGLGNELLTLGLATGLPRPAPPGSLFDPAAASASLAACAAYEDEHQVAAAGRLLRRTATQGPHSPGELQGPPSAVSAEAGPSATFAAEMIEGVDSPVVRTEGRRIDKAPAATAAAAAANAARTAPRVAAERVAGVAKEANVTLTRVFNRVQQGLSKAVEETTRGVRQLATNVEKGVATMIDGGASGLTAAGGNVPAKHNADWYASLPDLSAIFSRNVPEDDQTLARLRQRAQGRGGEDGDDDDDDVSILTISDEDDENESSRGRAAAPRNQGAGTTAARAAGPPPQAHAAPQPSAAAAAAQPPGIHGYRPHAPAAGRSAGGEEASLRNELFAGGRPYVSAGGAANPSSRPRHAPAGITHPHTRTADEIKRAYGRQPATSTARANEVRAVMEQNRSKLEERGEKLRQLNDKAADLESSAAGFAEMARQLAERERNKKWWQL